MAKNSEPHRSLAKRTDAAGISQMSPPPARLAFTIDGAFNRRRARAALVDGYFSTWRFKMFALEICAVTLFALWAAFAWGSVWLLLAILGFVALAAMVVVQPLRILYGAHQTLDPDAAIGSKVQSAYNYEFFRVGWPTGKSQEFWYKDLVRIYQRGGFAIFDEVTETSHSRHILPLEIVPDQDAGWLRRHADFAAKRLPN